MPVDDTLFRRLRSCTSVELGEIAKVLGVARSVDRDFDVVVLSKSLRNLAGDSVANLFRDEHELEYRDILIVVARRLCSRLGLNFLFKCPEGVLEESLEDAIWFLSEAVNCPENDEPIWTSWMASEARKTRVKRLEKTFLEMLMCKNVETDILAFGLLSVPVVSHVRMFSSPAYRKIVPATLVIVHARKRTEFETQLKEVMVTP